MMFTFFVMFHACLPSPDIRFYHLYVDDERMLRQLQVFITLCNFEIVTFLEAQV